MKIHLVIIEDRHTDVQVIPYYFRTAAIEFARTKARAMAFDEDDYKEENIEGWLFSATCSEEGDAVRVVTAEMAD